MNKEILLRQNLSIRAVSLSLYNKLINTAHRNSWKLLDL